VGVMGHTQVSIVNDTPHRHDGVYFIPRMKIGFRLLCRWLGWMILCLCRKGRLLFWLMVVRRIK